MKRRPFGSTGLSVSEIGLGGWQLGNPIWGEMEAAEAHRIVEAALAEGCTFFDTAPGYGEGRSEQLLGQAIKPFAMTSCSAPNSATTRMARLTESLPVLLRRIRATSSPDHPA